MKDDTGYVDGSGEPRAHINACGTGELTVFIDPYKVFTLTLMGDETKHYDIVEKPTSEQRCISWQAMPQGLTNWHWPITSDLMTRLQSASQTLTRWCDSEQA